MSDSTTSAPALTQDDPFGSTQQQTPKAYMRDYVDRVRGGDVGALPAILGLVALVVVFSIMKPVFFSAGNFANLLTQGAAVVIIAMGLVFVLLLGEIDLSAGVASGVCASVFAVGMSTRGWSWPIALVAALLTGAVIGFGIGILVSRVGIPSFVVTLAAFLAFQGVVLLIIGDGGNVSITADPILALANKNMSPLAGWILCIVGVGLYAAQQIISTRKRQTENLVTAPMQVVIMRVAAVGFGAALATYVLNIERSRNPDLVSLRGIPYVVPLILVLLIGLTFLLSKTAYGRYVYSVGGNAEASRRAGIDVKAIRTSVFVICSTMAAVGGLVAASRAASVDPNAGGANTLLYAVGAAVIGGTSLFGGKGKVRDAILGGAVIAIIDNGMGLLGYSSGVKFIVTGAVLLLAASVDALSRKRAAASGR